MIPMLHRTRTVPPITKIKIQRIRLTNGICAIITTTTSISIMPSMIFFLWHPNIFRLDITFSGMSIFFRSDMKSLPCVIYHYLNYYTVDYTTTGSKPQQKRLRFNRAFLLCTYITCYLDVIFESLDMLFILS